MGYCSQEDEGHNVFERLDKVESDMIVKKSVIRKEVKFSLGYRREEVYTGLCVYGWKRPEESCGCQYT